MAVLILPERKRLPTKQSPVREILPGNERTNGGYKMLSSPWLTRCRILSVAALSVIGLTMPAVPAFAQESSDSDAALDTAAPRINVPVWFIEAKQRDEHGNRLCLTDEGAGEPIELQVCDAKRQGQQWWLVNPEGTALWFIGSAVDQDYVLASIDDAGRQRVGVGNYFGLKKINFNVKAQNWREEYDTSLSNPTIYYQWNDTYVMEIESNSAGSQLVVARMRDPTDPRGPDPWQGFLIKEQPQ